MSLNKVILIGNVGKDPEIRYFDNGKAVTNFSLATRERGFTTYSGVQIPERTEWHNVVLRGLAEFAEKYVKKGSKIYVEGKIRTRSYEDSQGIKRYMTEVHGDNLILLDRKSDNKQQDHSISDRASISHSISESVDSAEGVEENDDLPF